MKRYFKSKMGDVKTIWVRREDGAEKCIRASNLEKHPRKNREWSMFDDAGWDVALTDSEHYEEITEEEAFLSSI